MVTKWFAPGATQRIAVLVNHADQRKPGGDGAAEMEQGMLVVETQDRDPERTRDQGHEGLEVHDQHRRRELPHLAFQRRQFPTYQDKTRNFRRRFSAGRAGPAVVIVFDAVDGGQIIIRQLVEGLPVGDHPQLVAGPAQHRQDRSCQGTMTPTFTRERVDDLHLAGGQIYTFAVRVDRQSVQVHGDGKQRKRQRCATSTAWTTSAPELIRCRATKNKAGWYTVRPRTKAAGVNCPAIDGIIEEANDVAGDVDDKSVLDAALIAAAQAVEHYEMTRYGTLIAWAKTLGRNDCAQVLQETLSEEKAADDKLTSIAESGVNRRAA